MGAVDEKRKVSRVDYKIEGQIRYKDKLYNGEITNYSLNGFSFCSYDEIDILDGEKITITIYLGHKIEDMISKVNCTVVRKVQNTVGMKFDAIDYDTLMYLKERIISIVGNEDKINDEFFNFIEGA